MLQQLVNGFTMGFIYVLIALGYTLIFGIIQVIFFAQGELSMLAAFAALGMVGLLTGYFGVSSLFLVVPVIVLSAIVISVATGVLAERLALRPLRDAPRIKPLITSLGISIILQNAVMLIVGPQNIGFPRIIDFPVWEVLGAKISILQLLIALIALAVVYILVLFTHFHPYGLAIRAIAQSPSGARLMGIEPDRVITITFMLSSSTAAVAGLAMILYYGVAQFSMGFVPGIKGFTVAILGGVGNLTGALVAGLLLGLGETLFAGYVSSDYKDFFVFALLVGTLVVRPQGLLGEGK